MPRPNFTLRRFYAHYVLDGVEARCGYGLNNPDPRLPRDARKFWHYAALDRCDGGVVAWRNGRVVGFCRYALDYMAEDLGDTERLYMAGTWVAPRYRRMGLATRMWGLIFKHLTPGMIVSAVTVTVGGDDLVQALTERWLELPFEWQRNHYNAQFG